MFLAMSPKYKPWDNLKLRQAVCYAIDRDLIIKNVLKGQADRLDGPIGPGQYGYDAEYAKKNLSIPYDPAKARELVKASGYNNEPVYLDTPVGRYINDKDVTEAMIPMLNAVGINAKLRTPEWATLWADVQRGKTPFYYMGRGSVVDPSVALSQYFETGGSPRIGISDPEIDKTLAAERVAFDPGRTQEGSQHRVQGDRGRSAGVLHVAASHALWREQVHRPRADTLGSRFRHGNRRQVVSRVVPGRERGLEFCRCCDTFSAGSRDDPRRPADLAARLPADPCGAGRSGGSAAVG